MILLAQYAVIVLCLHLLVLDSSHCHSFSRMSDFRVDDLKNLLDYDGKVCRLLFWLRCLELVGEGELGLIAGDI